MDKHKGTILIVDDEKEINRKPNEILAEFVAKECIKHGLVKK